jgi:hypothetical protein
MKTIECLLRPFRIHPENVERYDLSSFFAPDAEAEEKVVAESAGADGKGGEEGEADAGEERPRKRGRNDFEEKEKDEMEEEEEKEGEGKKEMEKEKGKGEEEGAKKGEETSNSNPAGRREGLRWGEKKKKAPSPLAVPSVLERTTVLEPLADMRGHTSFLTFAVKLARPSSSS